MYLAAAVRPDDEPAMARQVAELKRAVPQVRVRSGSYSEQRVRTVGLAALVLAGISRVFWFQAATLRGTPLAWMLPRRLPPHAVWPMAVAAAGGAAFCVLCHSLAVVAAAALGWKIARVARLPRILAEGGREALVMDRMAGGQAAAWAPAASAGDTDRRWWRPDAAIDSQLARPLPPATSAAAAFADMLRRPQSRVQILWLVGFMLVGAGVVSALPAILPGSVGAILLRAVGLAIRATVFRQLEDREIG